jgi:ribonuclease BN (tRNA processing enzyme)
MRLILLGTTGYHPNDRRQTPCMLLPAQGILLDAGTGMYRVGRYLETSELDIFLTHAHLDHVVGLTYLFDVMRARPLERVTVHGAAKTLAALDAHLFAEPMFPKKPPYRSQPLAPEVALRGGGRLTHFPLIHQGGSIGYRLDWPGHSMAYVTDTTASSDADYLEKIRGVDLLLHECYLPDDKAEWARQTGHSNTTAVGQVARRAEVGKLVLVHVNPLSVEEDPIGLPTLRAIFPNTELGEDLMEIEF